MQKESGTPGRARGDERGNGGNSPKSVSLRYLSTSPNTFAPCTCSDAPVRSPLRALSPMPARQVPKTGRKRASPPAYPVPLCPSAKPDQKSVVSGKRGSVRVDLGGRRIITKNKRE